MRTPLLITLLLLFAPSLFPADSKPNIVFFLADDLGWTGLHSFGSDFYETPHLDRLASKGVSFTDAYAACTVCSPTRASIMTGMYPARLRLTDFISGQNRPFAKMTIPNWTMGLDKKYTTIAEALRDEGYKTIQIGKWHLDFPNQEDQGPTAHGFDVAHDKPQGTRGYYISDQSVKSLGLKSNYTTDYLTDKAIEEIDRAQDEPFFLYFAYNVPHTPIQGRDDYVKYFQEKVDTEKIHQNPIYAAMVKSLDTSVGRVVDSLKKNGLLKNTLIVFTSDNGGLTQRYGQHDNFTENLPLKRGKGSAYEGGVRVPAIASWPGVIPEGVKSDTPIITMDYYPTFLEAAGVAENLVQNETLDGKSLISVFNNPRQSIRRNLFWHYPHYHAGGDGPYSAIRSGNWRLVEFHESGQVELYHLIKDPGETFNKSGINLKTRAQLRNRLNRWRESVAAQMPKSNPNFSPDRETEVVRNR